MSDLETLENLRKGEASNFLISVDLTHSGAFHPSQEKYYIVFNLSHMKISDISNLLNHLHHFI